ncbi:MAG TPA: HEAT repeat domain-containing protein [Planctomycetota bacterium]|nr:HEAT repeat domain-containing protein [Planctomycetota bacterium]
MWKRLLGLSLVAALGLPVLAKQDESFGDKVRQLLQEGTDLYKRGKFSEAASKFEEAFQMKPSSDQVYAFMKRAGDDLIAGMMNHPDRKIQDLGRRIYELAKPGEPLREGKAVVLKYIDDLRNVDDFERSQIAFWHLKNIGPYAVRWLIPVLGDKQQDRFRSRVILLLTEMGVDCSLAVVEALDSKDDFVRQQAAITLGNIKDERAIPALKRVVEDANEKSEVRKFAQEALMKIIRTKDAAQWKKATDYYYELAMKYYYSHSSAILAFQRAYLIWKWNKEGDKDVITERKVARFAYNEQLAEEAVFRLLELDPNYASGGYSGWSLLACIEFAQDIEAQAAIRAALEALKVDELDKPGLIRLIKETEGMKDADVMAAIGDEINKGAAWADVNNAVSAYLRKKAKVLRTNVVAQLPGKKYIYEALSRSLVDGNYLVAKACIETIEEMGRPEDLPSPPLPPDAANTSAGKSNEEVAGTGAAAAQQSGTLGHPLIEALANEDKRVRYAAAKAMASLNPQRRKLGMELVIPNLIDALGEQGVRVALVIYDVQDDNDRNFINGFRKTLAAVNVFPVMVTSGSEGIVKAKQFPTQDIIIVQRKICGQVYFKEVDTKKGVNETVFDTLRDDVRTKNIPKIILGDSQGEVDLAKKEFVEKGTALAAVGKDVHKLDLKALFEKAFDTEEARKDSKERADEIAKNAAETFAKIDPTNTLYPFRDAVAALVTTIGGSQVDNVNLVREDFIRIPAAQALGHFGDQRAIDVLTKVLGEKEADAEKATRQKGVRLACAKALSQVFKKTGITPSKEVFDVLMKNTKDGDYDIEFTSGEALGNAVLTNQQRLELAKFRRVEHEVVTPDDP